MALRLGYFVLAYLCLRALLLTEGNASGLSGLEVRTAQSGQSEKHERNVDRAALASQQKAIAKLSVLLAKYRGTRQEPILLARMAELQQQKASIHFRIAHGSSRDLRLFKKSMHQTISTLNELITKYPRYEEIPLAYYMRGKSYEEIDYKTSATRDYLYLVSRYPHAPESIPAYMSLAEFSIESNDHAKAIRYLREVEKRPDSPHYPFALYKLAWSHYNLKDIPTTLRYAERNASYYASAQERSDEALRENILLDMTVFFMEGYEQKLPQFQISEALPYFKKQAGDPKPGTATDPAVSQVFGKMLVRYAKLLRSHGHEADLVRWKDQILLSESDRPESLDVLITTYENQLNRRRYSQLVESSRDMVRLYGKNPKFESFAKARKLLLDTAEGLHGTISKNKNAHGVQQLSTTLAAIYDAFTKVVDESDSRIPRVHYNLAETLFEIKEYEQATTHYRWIVERGKNQIKDAGLKAIAARYEVLRQRQLIPSDLRPVKISEDEPEDGLDQATREWIEWVDEHMDRSPSKVENFYFEANRVLYSKKQIKRGVERMRKFALRYPKSRFAIPSAVLTLDTYVITENWEESHDLANGFMDVKDWKGTEFSKKVFSIAADSHYKMIEIAYQAKEYKESLSRADDFLEKYGKSGRLSDCLNLAGNSALALNRKDRAMTYFSRLIAETPNAETVHGALLARASMHEDRYRFIEAARDYRSLLAHSAEANKIIKSAGEADKFRKKTLALAWLSGDPTELRASLSSKAICTDSLADECDKYEALSLFQSPRSSNGSSTVEMAFNRARKGPADNRALWAAVALEEAKSLAFRDRLVMVRQLAKHWGDLDSTSQFALIPRISESIPRTFQLNRMAIRSVAPLRANERYITRRIEVIREMENAAAPVMKLPWSRVRALVLSETAGLYLDLSKGLHELPPPKDLPPAEVAEYEATIRKLAVPFDEKGQEMRSKAFEIASHYAIEEESLRAVAEPFFQDNPSQAKALQTLRKAQGPRSLDLALLDRLDPSGDWKSIGAYSKDESDFDDRVKNLKLRWIRSTRTRNWQMMAFCLQEAQEKALFQAGAMGIVRTVSLALAGARGEALLELESARGDLAEDPRLEATRVLISHYESAYSRSRTQALTSDLPQTEAGT